MGRCKDLSIVGTKVGKLTIGMFLGLNKSKKREFSCKCECGNMTKLTYSVIKRKSTLSCGCLCKNSFKDNSGESYNNITLVKLVGKNKYKSYEYEVKCHCGKIFIHEGNDILSGKIKSCGCRTNSILILNADYKSTLRSVIYAEYRNKAKKRGYEFALSKDHVCELIKQNCYYCNSEPLNIKKSKKCSLPYNGIDRLDNTLGYIENNVVSCCRICNQAKHTMSLNYFKHWIEKIIIAKNDRNGFWNG